MTAVLHPDSEYSPLPPFPEHKAIRQHANWFVIEIHRNDSVLEAAVFRSLSTATPTDADLGSLENVTGRKSALGSHPQLGGLHTTCYSAINHGAYPVHPGIVRALEHLS